MTAGGSSRSGVLVTFEGCEGSGKSTVCARVLRLIGESGYDCWRGSEPGGTVLGHGWREQILNPTSKLSPVAELFLFLADRAQNFAENIAPKLDAGCVVLLDRHRDSTAAYQGAGRGHDMSLIERCNDVTTTPMPAEAGEDLLPRRPDLTILLDIDPEAGLRRSKRGEYGVADRIEAEDISFHTKIRESFLRLAEQEPRRFVVLDAVRPLEEVVSESFRLVGNLLAEKGIRPRPPVGSEEWKEIADELP